MENGLKGAKRGGFIYTSTFLLYFAVALIGQTILNLAGASGTAFYAVNSLFPAMVFIGASVLSAGKKPKMPYMRKFSYKYIAPIFLLAFGMLLGLGFLNSLVAEGIKSVGGKITDITIPLDNFFQYLLFTVFLGVLPAFSEEVFFRGVLLNSMSFSGKSRAIFTVALCFALYHGNISQLVYQFIYGVCLGILATSANSVIPCIIAHFINNFTVLTIEYFKISLDLLNPFIIAMGIALLIVFAAIIFVSDKNAKTDSKSEKTESIKEFYFPYGIVGIIAAVMLVILSVIPL